MELPQFETSQESLDRLRREVDELRASRERLVVGADADRRSLERDLHDGPQQQLIALAVKVQLARQLADSDPSAAKALLDELERDVHEALEETSRLAHRIYPPLLEAGGLVAALRAAALGSRIHARIDVSANGRYPAEVAGAVYFSCLAALESIGEGGRATVTIRDEAGILAFEVVEDESGHARSPSNAALAVAPAQDRLEALGGRLTTEPGEPIRVSGSLPLSR